MFLKNRFRLAFTILMLLFLKTYPQANFKGGENPISITVDNHVLIDTLFMPSNYKPEAILEAMYIKCAS